MAKKNGSIIYKCSKCGYSQPRWLGRCPDCGEWNSLEEIIIDKNNISAAGHGTEQAVKQKPVSLASVKAQENSRLSTGIEEFDRVLGGGASKNSVILLGGEPGIGKSTLPLQTIASISESSTKSVLYISGEESAPQIKERAERLKVNTSSVKILCTSRLEDCLDALDSLNPEFVIIDSIQTIYSVEAGIIPGTVNQLKYCANEFILWAKNHESVLIMTAHVTKDGNIAGPKSLEHMVDTVLYFEGDRYASYRVLRAVKNRFGSTNEIGVFEMTETGLCEVQNPSALCASRSFGFCRFRRDSTCTPLQPPIHRHA